MPGISITPSLNDITITPGVPQVVRLTVTNTDPVSRLMDISIADAIRKNTGSGVELVAPNPSSSSLSEIATLLTQKTFALDAGVSAEIRVQLGAGPELGTAGRYGAVVVAVQDGVGNDSVALQSSVAALVFAKSSESDEATLELTKNEGGSIFSLPESVTLTVKNTGSVHTAPRGRVLLITPKKEVIAQGVVNETSSIVLPESERIFDTKLTYLPNVTRSNIGEYQLITEYRANGSLEPFLKTETVLFIDPRLAVIASILFLTSTGGIFWLLKRRKERYR